MIAHAILFTPRGDLTEAMRQNLVSDLREAARSIPSIRRFRFGPRVRHGLPGYEQAMREAYEYLVLVEFEDLEGLKQYLAHAAHGKIGRHFTASAERALAYDFDVEEIARQP